MVRAQFSGTAHRLLSVLGSSPLESGRRLRQHHQDGDDLVAWLVTNVLPDEDREDQVREVVFERCSARHIEPPSTGRIDRLVRSAFHTFEEHWCAAVLEQLGLATQQALDELLATGGTNDSDDDAAESRRSVLNELKADAGAISLDSVITEITKLERLRSLGLPRPVRRRARLAAEPPPSWPVQDSGLARRSPCERVREVFHQQDARATSLAADTFERGYNVQLA